MSALGGVYNLDGAPVDEKVLAALGKGLAYRCADGGLEYRSGSIGMAFRAFHTTEESRLEVQPLISSRGDIICWGGRLDNREELIARLVDDPPGECSDLAIVMAAYSKWGGDMLPIIIGDFALSLWDASAQTLLLARDAFGTRALYYHADAERVIWSSELRPLLDLCGVGLKIDDEYVAGYLTNTVEMWRTPFEGIRSIQPGHALLVRGGRLEERRFWSPDPKREIYYKSDSGYEEHFRSLFRESVQRRLRSDRPVWAQLSGGLDSSSVVCMADQIIASGGASIQKLETVSYLYPDSPTADESEFIACVEEQRGSPGVHICEDDDLTLAYLADESLEGMPNGLIGPGNRFGRLCGELKKRNARVLLSGQCGDHLLWSGVEASPELADLLVGGRVLELGRRLRAWGRVHKRPYLQLLWKGAVFPILPRWVQVRYYAIESMPQWLDQKFVARMSLRERMVSPSDSFGFGLPSRKAQWDLLSSAISMMFAEHYWERGGIEVRLPYLHRPLVEFLLAIPFEQKIRPGEPRSLHRRALRDVLPQRIARRKGKRGTDEAFFRGVAREWPKLDAIFADACVCARGYAQPALLKEALERARRGSEAYTSMLSSLISIEFWLRALERRGAKVRDSVKAGSVTSRATTS
jgi:asparagine synthase (glutamine-hydrolysing)